MGLIFYVNKFFGGYLGGNKRKFLIVIVLFGNFKVIFLVSFIIVFGFDIMFVEWYFKYLKIRIEFYCLYYVFYRYLGWVYYWNGFKG